MEYDAMVAEEMRRLQQKEGEGKYFFFKLGEVARELNIEAIDVARAIWRLIDAKKLERAGRPTWPAFRWIGD